ncbi:MAG: acyl-CoA thioesterase [Actinomycetota bacterium]
MLTVPVYRRFSDLDPLGHVNNVAYHDYLQEARMGLIGDLDAVVSADFAQIVVSQEIRHRKPLGHSPEPVRIEIGISNTARTSYTIDYRILDEDGEVAAEATTLMAVVDPASGRPIRIPKELLGRLTPHQIEA